MDFKLGGNNYIAWKEPKCTIYWVPKRLRFRFARIKNHTAIRSLIRDALFVICAGHQIDGPYYA